ncbi:DUF6488 family protein [Halobacteriovorax sp. HLS]|uniref:DUF6488 family protein n=1 Tax=Halobacteriovorax sp. HLS TaxID=2234000 RepID=UPI000FDC16B4|nr:DUF6488 family protein [Halobacteriovorax sp. HLS]
MKYLLLIGSLLFSFSSFAGPGGGHSHGHSHSHSKKSISIEKTEEVGRYHVKRLINSGKIDASWKSSTFDKSEKKKFGKKTEWVVTFDNEKGVKGKKLYIFLKLSGEFVAANFTGK